MTGYTPLFEKIVDSSLWLEPDFVVKIFITMMAKKDKDNVVRGSAFNISQWAKKTELEVLEALKILAAPDTRRLEPQEFEGRRVEKVEDGWLMLNGKTYQDLMVKINRRAYKRNHEAQRRKNNPIPETTSQEAVKLKTPTLEECKARAIEIGMNAEEGESFFNYQTAGGWMRGRTKVKSWRHSMDTWKKNWKNNVYGTKNCTNGRQPSQRVDRNVGTSNEGKADQYKGLGKVPGV